MISLGPDGVQETLRKGLAMGAARAVQLKADDVPFDGLAIAHALAAELKDGGYDLILFGRMATDTANGTVGPMTAELLDLPCVTAISHLEIADGRGTARRELEGAAETVEFPLPAVLTIDEGIARPRLASLKGIMAAKKKPLEVKPAQLGKVSLVVESMALPPERAAGPDHRRGRRCGARAPPTAPDRSEGAVMAPILAFAESRDGELRKVAFETVTAARQAADASGGGEVHAMRHRRARHRRAGGGARPLRRRCRHRGGAGDARALQPRSHSRRPSPAAQSGGYRAAFFAASAQGRDLAPRVAARLGVSLASDVTGFELQGDAVVARHPAYTGKVIVTLRLTGTPALLSLRPGAVTAAEQPRTARVEKAAPAMDPAAAR